MRKFRTLGELVVDAESLRHPTSSLISWFILLSPSIAAAPSLEKYRLLAPLV
jgi:hypothetical protein